jgi:hypothetical protein
MQILELKNVSAKYQCPGGMKVNEDQGNISEANKSSPAECDKQYSVQGTGAGAGSTQIGRLWHSIRD